jgi:negative regulator of flagellin synthesis FlgM
MITKVKDSTSQLIQQYQNSSPVKNEGEKSVGGGAQSVSTEKVDLSAKAKDFQRIRKILDQTPDVRQEKVAALKDRIANGSYVVDSGKVAAKMAGEHLIDTIA